MAESIAQRVVDQNTRCVATSSMQPYLGLAGHQTAVLGMFALSLVKKTTLGWPGR
jgi:hypothetical protein